MNNKVDSSIFKIANYNNILSIEFYNSKTQNALGLSEVQSLLKIIKEHPHASGILFTNSGRIFCSGGHLKNYALGEKKSHGININRKLRALLDEFSKLTVPTVAAVQGDCFGGGLEFLSCFDKVFSTPENFFGMWQTKIGLSWGWGGGYRLLQRISNKKLVNILLNAKTISAYNALDIGLIDSVIPQEFLVKKSLEAINIQNSLPKEPQKLIKKFLGYSFSQKNEIKVFERLWWNPFHKEILKKYK